MEFVSVDGRKIDIEKAKAVTNMSAAPKEKTERLRSVKTEKNATKHLGFKVTGISVASLDIARSHAINSGKHFDEVNWLKNAKRERCVGRIYQLREAADLAANLVIREGKFVRVMVDQILRG